MTGFIASVCTYRNRVSFSEAFEGLEPDEGKLSRPVLRGPGSREAAWLLGKQAIDGTGTFTPLDPQSCRLLVTALPLPPRRNVISHRSARAMPCCLRPYGEDSASGSNFF
jgi:hypothetical protein